MINYPEEQHLRNQLAYRLGLILNQPSHSEAVKRAQAVPDNLSRIVERLRKENDRTNDKDE